MSPNKPNSFESRFFDLLEDTIQGIDRKVDKLTDELKTNSQVTQKVANKIGKLEDKVNNLEANVNNLNEIIFPPQAKKSSDLPPFWRDEKVIKLFTLAVILLTMIVAVLAGVMGIKLPGTP